MYISNEKCFPQGQKVVIAIGAVAYLAHLTVDTPYVVSVLLKWHALPYAYKAETVRSLFTDVPEVAHKAIVGHPHGTSAANRSSGSTMIDLLGKSLGRTMWFYQCSRADQRNGRIGSRTYYWGKDFGAAPAPFEPRGGDCVAMVDVDQYVDMPAFMTKHFRPIILYTFQPSKVADTTKDYSFTFDAQNSVEYVVRGGATYRHPVWNYSSDTITVFKLWNWRGWFVPSSYIPFWTTVYNVDKRQMDDHHQLICLTPLAQWRGGAALLARGLGANMLKRLKISCGDFLRMLHIGTDGPVMSTGRVGEYIHVETPPEVDSALAITARTSKVGLTAYQVKSQIPEAQNAAMVLYEYHTQKNPGYHSRTFAGAEGVRRYQFIGGVYDPDAKPSMVAYMQPLVDGAFCPDKTECNDRRAVKSRITDVKSEPNLTPMLMKFVDEFVTLFLCPDEVFRGTGDSYEGRLLPVDYQDVYEKQTRPTQRRIIAENEMAQPKRVGKSFMKREAYGKVQDPRIITTLNGRDKVDYATYIYAIGHVLKRHRWYAFGRTPIEISLEVVRVASEAETHVGKTDFHRMDGTNNEVTRYLEKQLLIRAFAPEHTETIIDLFRAHHGIMCYMSSPQGTVAYDPGFARLSGEVATSAFNTMINACVAFVAWRMTRNDLGRFLTPTEAWCRLGIYGGDDGLSADLSAGVYHRAAKMFGMSLDYEPVKRGQRGVAFLNRCYGPDVWHGDPVSHSDIVRALAKFHTTTNMPPNITPLMKLTDKAFAYWLSDRNTPVLGQFVSKVIELSDEIVFKNLGSNWFAQFESGEQFPNDCRDWMSEDATDSLAQFNVNKFEDWLASVTELEHLLSPPHFCDPLPPRPTAPAVLEGELVTPEAALHETKRRRNPTEQRRRRRTAGAGRQT